MIRVVINGPDLAHFKSTLGYYFKSLVIKASKQTKLGLCFLNEYFKANLKCPRQLYLSLIYR